ncbi:MAG: hypothetical protein V7K97_15440 [Nostoc sp.]|uniref:hypothetical protein n=1 Tax=Nostoc sp. TaxID=1180 RepID=UPI002FF761F4
MTEEEHKTTFLTIEELKTGNPRNKPDIRHDSADKQHQREDESGKWGCGGSS